MKSEELIQEEIAGGLFRLSPPSPMWPAAASVYVVIGNGSFSLVDVGCGRPDALDRLTARLSKLGLDPAPPEPLVPSHAHPDHMGAAQSLLEGCSPRVLIHADDSKHARDPRGLIGTFDIELAERLYGKAEGMVAELFSFFDGSG